MDFAQEMQQKYDISGWDYPNLREI
jgi:hypothetical protein